MFTSLSCGWWKSSLLFGRDDDFCQKREGCYWLSTSCWRHCAGSSQAYAVEATKVVTAATDGGEILCGHPKQAAQASTSQPHFALDEIPLDDHPHDTQKCGTCGKASVTGRQHRRYHGVKLEVSIRMTWLDHVKNPVMDMSTCW